MGIKAGPTSIAVLVLLAAPRPASPAEPALFKVVVNAGVPGKRIPRPVLADVFLRRVVKWSDGSPIRPVDLSLTTPLRLAFTKAVFGFTALEVQAHWRKALSQGVVPPPVKPSEDEVIAFVAANAGGIGYVSEATPTPDTVKVLEIE